jgi:D-alanine-D-alanine ligase
MTATAQNAAAFGNVALLYGGTSSEREISLRSGTAVFAALQRLGVAVTALDTAATGTWGRLQVGGFDRAFIMLHGRGGEDGVVQGFLQTLGIPYTGSTVLGSALGMDKLRCKRLWQGQGLATPAFYAPASAADLEVIAASLGFPLVLKPSLEGSSIGVVKVESHDQLAAAWQESTRFGTVIAEHWVQGNEYTVALLHNQALPVIRVAVPSGFYDYQAKYFTDSTRYFCPSGLTPAQEQAVQALALQAFNAVGGRGWGRVDVMLDAAGGAWLLEVNTVPGMTDHSLVPMAAKAAGLDFATLVWRILETSLES